MSNNTAPRLYCLGQNLIKGPQEPLGSRFGIEGERGAFPHTDLYGCYWPTHGPITALFREVDSLIEQGYDALQAAVERAAEYAVDQVVARLGPDNISEPLFVFPDVEEAGIGRLPYEQGKYVHIDQALMVHLCREIELYAARVYELPTFAGGYRIMDSTGYQASRIGLLPAWWEQNQLDKGPVLRRTNAHWVHCYATEDEAKLHGATWFGYTRFCALAQLRALLRAGVTSERVFVIDWAYTPPEHNPLMGFFRGVRAALGELGNLPWPVDVGLAFDFHAGDEWAETWKLVEKCYLEVFHPATN